MEISSPRFKAIVVSLGFSLWFFLITSALGLFSLSAFLIFIISIFIVTQILSRKLSATLDVFATINTKVFLGLIFVTVFSIYGILFRLLRIDLLRLRKQSQSYWLEMEQLEESRILKRY